MQVTDAMVNAALTRWFNGGTNRFMPHEREAMRGAIQAALATAISPTNEEREGLRWILTTTMSEISEENNRTQWDMRLSRALFEIIETGDDLYRYGLNDREIGGLRFLRDAIGEWPEFNTSDGPDFIWWPVREYRAHPSGSSQS